MSLAGSRLSLTDKCVVERPTNLEGASAWNVPCAPTWGSLHTRLPCRLLVNSGQERTHAETNVEVIDMRLLVPLGTDVVATDRVSAVTRRGVTVVDGPVGIRAVLPRRTHLELVLVGLS